MTDDTGVNPNKPIERDLLDAAVRLIERGGLAALSLSALAEESGRSRVTLHRRGTTIEQYVVAVTLRATTELRDGLWPSLTDEGNASERLDQALRSLCDFCDRNGGLMRALYAIKARPDPEQPDRTTSVAFTQPFERLLRDGLVDGSLTCADPVSEATLLANAVGWTYIHLRQAHEWEHEELTNRVIAMATADLT